MTTPGCTRAWQAAAAEDGRLSEADARSFQRHAATCETCEREVRVLSALQETAARLPILTSTPLERRRLRNELLRRANALSLGAPRGGSPSFRILIAACAFVALVGVALWVGRPRRSSDVVALPFASVPTFRITPSAGAEWRTLERSGTLRLSLLGGQFDLAVDKLHPGQHFLLELPDGELEVKGTRFVVHVEGSRTLAVRVEEGVVALRIRGAPSKELVAGDGWQASPATTPAKERSTHPESPRSTGSVPAPEASVGTRPPATPQGSETAAAPIPPSGRAGEAAHGRTTQREAQAATAPSVGAAVPAPSVGAAVPAPSVGAAVPAPSVPSRTPPHDFTIAMTAFSAGDYGRAERLFLDFERRNPSDARVEDSTFLRAVARSRRGDSTGAVAVAREYLRRYPNGLRRADAERLANP